jgi:hypothetical protein
MGANPASESDDAEIALAEALVFHPAGMVVERIPRRPGEKKTADLRMYALGSFIGFCEVKAPQSDWLEAELAVAPAGAIVGESLLCSDCAAVTASIMQSSLCTLRG